MPHYHGEDDTRVPACTIGHSLAWRVPYFRSTQVAFLHAGLILPYSFCLIHSALFNPGCHARWYALLSELPPTVVYLARGVHMYPVWLRV